MFFVLCSLLMCGAAVLGRRRPLLLVMSGLVLQCLFPAVVATTAATGPVDVALHPGSMLVLVAFVLHVARRPVQCLTAWHRNAEIIVVAVSACVVMLGLSVFAGGGDAPSFVVDQVAAPIAAFLLVGAELTREPGRIAVVRHVVLALGVLEALFAQLQAVMGNVILFASGYATQKWFGQSSGVDRWMGTLDHPLVLSLFLVGCLPLTASIRRWWVALPLVLVLVGGILASQSRTGLALAAVAVVYVLSAGRAPIRARLGMCVVSGGAVIAAVAAGVFDGVLARFTDASDQSNAARAWAGDYFFDRLLHQYLWTGRGSGASYRIAQEGGLISSFENSFYIYTLDFGLVTAALYFGAMIACLVVCVARAADRSWAVAGALLIVSAVSFSGLGVRSAAPMMMWIVFSAAAFGARRGRAPATDVLAPGVGVTAAQLTPGGAR